MRVYIIHVSVYVSIYVFIYLLYLLYLLSYLFFQCCNLFVNLFIHVCSMCYSPVTKRDAKGVSKNWKPLSFIRLDCS